MYDFPLVVQVKHYAGSAGCIKITIYLNTYKLKQGMMLIAYMQCLWRQAPIGWRLHDCLVHNFLTLVC